MASIHIEKKTKQKINNQEEIDVIWKKLILYQLYILDPEQMWIQSITQIYKNEIIIHARISLYEVHSFFSWQYIGC